MTVPPGASLASRSPVDSRRATQRVDRGEHHPKMRGHHDFLLMPVTDSASTINSGCPEDASSSLLKFERENRCWCCTSRREPLLPTRSPFPTPGQGRCEYSTTPSSASPAIEDVFVVDDGIDAYEAALRRIPEAYSLALPLQDAGVADEVMRNYLRIEPQGTR